MNASKPVRTDSLGPEAASTLTSIVAHLARSSDEAEIADETINDLAEQFGQGAARQKMSLADAFDRLLSAAESIQGHVPGLLAISVIRGYERERSAEGWTQESGGPGPLSDDVTRLAALRRINQAATTSLDLDAMLQTVVGVVRETMNCDSCSIFLFDEANSLLELSASIGLNQDAIGRVFLPLGSGITGQAALSRQLLAVPDATEHPKYVDYPLIGDQRYSSQVSVPLALRSPSRLVGVLNILSLNRREFAAAELAFLETAAGEMAIAIENARLYSQTDAELQRRISQLSTLQQMSRMVASTLELSELLQLISEQTVDLSNAVGVEIYRLRRGDTERLELLSRHTSDGSRSLDEANDEVRQLVDDVMGSLAAIWRSVGTEQADLFVQGLPMLRGRRVVGAICVFHTSRPPEDSEASTLLDAFCDSAAIAIENANLYEEARRGYTRASILLQEMHHRVRNNLQTVAALLSMQARHTDDTRMSVPLREAVTRIQSIAAIHDILSGGDLRETTVDVIAKHVADDATANLAGPEQHVTFTIVPSTVHVNSREATALALLVNEFVMNAIGHGFTGRTSGHIVIRADYLKEDAVIEIEDDGAGLPEDFSLDSNRRLGLNIARTLVESDLRGTLSLERMDEGGTRVRIRFTPSGRRNKSKTSE